MKEFLKLYKLTFNEYMLYTHKIKRIGKYDMGKEEYELMYASEDFDVVDIVFLDPPYKENQLDKSLRIIEERDLLNENGIVICEYEIGEPHTNLELIKEKSYGPKKIKIYKNNL